MRHFPFDSDRYELTMNVRAGFGPLVEVDAERYARELALKDAILASDYPYYFQCPPNAVPLAWEAIATLLPGMARHFSQHFALTVNDSEWTWHNALLNKTTVFTMGDAATLPLPPLDWLGRQTQEDLILMAETPDGDSVCAGGQLCFAASWCLQDKMGRNFLDVHAPVPEFAERIGQPSHLLMQRLKPGRPVGRWNWTIAATDRLNCAPAVRHEWGHLRQGITAQNAGERVFLRLERQTFARLPETRGILFAIHTYIHPVSEIAADPEHLRRFASVVREMPPAVREYKNMTPFYNALVQCLDAERERHAR